MNETLTRDTSLADTIRNVIVRHIEESGKNNVIDLHQMVLEQIEPPLLKATMAYYKYNQSRAAIALGMSRGTFRKLLIKYFDEQYCGRKL
ncbi:MAG: DNA-binding protein Fis [Legionella sp.]|uniref:helix-turn-helix domain-containing protein n=1 Tax=Legionella sp. TaxID=459 RepID=UPI003D0D6E35